MTVYGKFTVTTCKSGFILSTQETAPPGGQEQYIICIDVLKLYLNLPLSYTI